jgi:hypothetical protein
MSHSLPVGCPVWAPTLTGVHQDPETVTVPVHPWFDR